MEEGGIQKDVLNLTNRKLEDTRMKIVIINGSARKGNTLNRTQLSYVKEILHAFI